jgi:hypothetical protein
MSNQAHVAGIRGGVRVYLVSVKGVCQEADRRIWKVKTRHREVFAIRKDRTDAVRESRHPEHAGAIEPTTGSLRGTPAPMADIRETALPSQDVSLPVLLVDESTETLEV